MCLQSEDQDELVYKVAAEHIKAVNQTSQATYLIDRMRGLPVGQLPHKGLREVIDAATALIAARKLMTIHVQTGSHAAATLTAYEGDDVKNLTAEFQATGGLSEEQGDLVRGAVLLTFHQHKIHAQRILAKVAENELPGMVRDSNSGHQLLLPTADWCPIFAVWTTRSWHCDPADRGVVRPADGLVQGAPAVGGAPPPPQQLQ